MTVRSSGVSPSSSTAPAPHRATDYLAPLISGTLLVFAYEPFSVPVLPFVGLAPLFWFFARPRSAREVFLGGWAFCLPYFGGNIYWLFYLGNFTLAGFGGALGGLILHWASFFLFPIGMNVVNHVLEVPLVVSAPVLWTVSEHARAQGDFNFPWVTLGYTLAGWPRIAQHADIVGVYGVSFWLAAINALIVTLVLVRRRRRAMLAYGALLAVVVLVPLGYGVVRWSRVEAGLRGEPTLRVAVVQPDIPQRLKWDTTARETNLARLNRLIAVAEDADPDLVVGPEACLPIIVAARDDRLPAAIEAGRSPLLLGVIRGLGEPEEVVEGGRRGRRYRQHLNSAVLAGPDRVRIGAHDKNYLVPVTEQIPYRRVFGIFLPFMRKQFGRFVAASDPGLLTLTGHDPAVRFGALICYESLFTGLVRRMSLDGASLLVNLTNDAWFGRSSMSFQHLGQSVLRAIECRRSVVIAANTGVSAFIDPLGRVRRQTPIFRETTFVERVPLASELTVYARWGDVVLYACCYPVVVVLLVLAWRAHRRRPHR